MHAGVPLLADAGELKGVLVRGSGMADPRRPSSGGVFDGRVKEELAVWMGGGGVGTANTLCGFDICSFDIKFYRFFWDGGILFTLNTV